MATRLVVGGQALNGAVRKRLADEGTRRSFLSLFCQRVKNGSRLSLASAVVTQEKPTRICSQPVKPEGISSAQASSFT